tara:strand:- start:1172 stop:2101 length:930 start_codon:yes stop_codon:yes gene_type:complete
MKFHNCSSTFIDVSVDSPEELLDLAFAHELPESRSFYAPWFAKGWNFARMRKWCKKQAARLENRRDWTMDIVTRKDAEELLCNPPEWMVDRAHECLDKIESVVANMHLADIPRRRRLRNLEDGSSLMTERVLTRHPEPWEDMHRVSVTSKVVRIIVNMTTPWNMPKENLVYRGAAAVASAMEIERRGGKCEIYITTCCAGSSTRGGFGTDGLALTALIKPVDEPTTVSRTLATCAHIGFYRCVVLNSKQTIARSSTAEHSYGSPRAIWPNVLSRYQADVVIDHKDTTLTKACAAVERAVAALKPDPQPA